MVGTAVPVPPSVIVLDHNKQGVAGVTVRFAVTVGAGTVSKATQTTDANGRAAAGSWVLGPAPGANTLTATIHRLRDHRKPGDLQRDWHGCPRYCRGKVGDFLGWDG
jgi:hypothetical protein